VSLFGVLALQGGFAAHVAALGRLGVPVREVRRCAQLAGLRGLVLPGGESTALLNLMRDEPWFTELAGFHAAGGALLGTCAGAILLARDVRPSQPSLGLLDVSVERNAYGRQVDSFERTVPAAALGAALRAVFIRAPRFTALGPEVRVLAALDGEPVLVRQGRVVAAAFHPELTDDLGVHRLFVSTAAAAGSAGASSRGTVRGKAATRS
jgi:pyridoxal 5'-phosphate synthase pdxT subunit